MKKIDNQTVVIDKNAYNIVEKLSDFNNFKEFLPENKVEDWQIDGNVCSFTVANIGNISVELESDIETLNIKYKTLKSPVHLELVFELTKLTENSTQIDISVFSNSNPMVLMMIKHPIRNLLQMITEKANELSDKLIS